MIEIPRSPTYRENEKRVHDGTPCVVCGRRVNAPRYVIQTWQGGFAVKEEERRSLVAANGVGGDSGVFPLGRDCLRKHRQLTQYAVAVHPKIQKSKGENANA